MVEEERYNMKEKVIEFEGKLTYKTMDDVSDKELNDRAMDALLKAENKINEDMNVRVHFHQYKGKKEKESSELKRKILKEMQNFQLTCAENRSNALLHGLYQSANQSEAAGRAVDNCINIVKNNFK